jgi:maleate isomerase
MMAPTTLAKHSTLSEYLQRGRVGLVVPPANPTSEPEVTRLLGTEYALHTTRFPVSRQPLRARLESYNADLPTRIASFGGLNLDALLVACSGSRYLLGPQQDHDTCVELSAQFGLPVATATLATHQMLRQLDTQDLVLVSPYEEWLTEQARQYWQRAGWRVRVLVVHAGNRRAPYEIRPVELVEQVDRARLAHDAVVLCTGTGMATLPALPALGDGTNRVLLTSNLCGAWWLMRQAGVASDELPWALRRLAAQGLAP